MLKYKIEKKINFKKIQKNQPKSIRVNHQNLQLWSWDWDHPKESKTKTNYEAHFLKDKIKK
jgi:hypothetical protein